MSVKPWDDSAPGGADDIKTTPEVSSQGTGDHYGRKLDDPKVFWKIVAAIVAAIVVIAAVAVWSLSKSEGDVNLPPVADAGNGKTTEVGAEVRFDGTKSKDPDGDIVLFNWDMGDGTVVRTRSPTHVYAAPGNYTVTLKVKDNENATAQDSVIITVLEHLPLEVRRVGVMVFGTSAVVTWYTNKPASSEVIYSENGDLSGAANVSDLELKHYHQMSLVGLTAGTEYYFKVSSETEWCDEAECPGTQNFTAGDDSYSFYFGNTHCHTRFSDGQGNPSDAYGFARDSANIDFLETTDHGYMLNDEEWKSEGKAAWEYTENGSFLAMRGYEWTHNRLGHMNVHGTELLGDKDVTPDLDAWHDWLLENSTVPATFNHPTEKFGNNWDNFRWTPDGDRAVSTLEIGNSKGYNYEDAYIEALDKNWHVGPIYGQDNHDWTWGAKTTALTGVVAPSLTYEDIYGAYANMRTTAVWDRMELLLLANGQLMGGEISHQNTVELFVSARDVTFHDNTSITSGTEVPEVFTKVEVFLDGEVVASTSPNATEHVWEPQLQVGEGSHYVFVKVTQEDGDVGYTAPVWLRGEKDVRALRVEVPSNSAKLGSTLNATCVILNQGDADETVSVELYAGNWTAGNLVWAGSVQAPAGELTEVVVPWAVNGSLGERTLSLRIGALAGDAAHDNVANFTLFVLETNATSVLLDMAHNNDYYDSLEGFNDVVPSWGLFMTENTHYLDGEVLQDQDVVVMTYPEMDLRADEIDALKEFIEGGGSLLITGKGDYYAPTGAARVNAVLEGIGSSIRMNDDEIIDDTNHGRQAWNVIAHVFPQQSTGIGAGVDSVIVWACASLLDGDMGPLTNDDGVIVLTTGDDDTYNKNADSAEDAYIYSSGKDIPFFALEEIGAGRIAVMGMTIFNDYQWGDDGHENEIFTEQVLEWLAA